MKRGCGGWESCNLAGMEVIPAAAEASKERRQRMQTTTPMIDALSRYLDLSSLQLKASAQNMANVDTPGYRTVGFDFAAEMGHCLDSMEKQPAAGEGALPEMPQLGLVDGLLERPDGNNVSMDREGMQMAESQLQFKTGVELLKHEFSRVLDAIHEDQK